MFDPFDLPTDGEDLMAIRAHLRRSKGVPVARLAERYLAALVAFGDQTIGEVPERMVPQQIREKLPTPEPRPFASSRGLAKLPARSQMDAPLNVGMILVGRCYASDDPRIQRENVKRGEMGDALYDVLVEGLERALTSLALIVHGTTGETEPEVLEWLHYADVLEGLEEISATGNIDGYGGPSEARKGA